MVRRVTRAKWVGRLCMGAVSAAAIACPAVASAQAQAVEPTGEAAIAWRLDTIARAQLAPDQPEATFRQSAALLEGAQRLLPQEPRFPRLRTLALEQIGDTDGAIKALSDYRKLEGGDTIAQLHLIDLFASRLQTLDARVNYLSDLVNNPKYQLPPEVRSQLAAEAAALLAEKSPELARAMVTQAVKIYPVPAATRLYYQYVGRNEPFADRAKALLNVIKADPNQPMYLSEFATLLAENGLSEASLLWYDLAMYTVQASRAPLPVGWHQMLVDYAAERLISGKITLADTMVGQMLVEQPLDPDAWFLKLTIDRSSTDQMFNQSLGLARNAFVQRWNALREEVLTGKPASAPAVATQPAAPAADGEVHTPDKIEPLDPAPVVEKLRQPNDAESDDRAKAMVVAVAGDLAWLELYYGHDPKAATRWVDVVRQLSPADSPTLRRLDGWLALDEGNPSKARGFLEKLQATDPLSALGMIVADRDEKRPADPAAVKKLLDEHRVGLVGAILWSVFKNEQERPTSRPSTQFVEQQINALSSAYLLVLDPRNASRVYSVVAEPVQGTFDFGTAVLARVTIENISDVDLTIGPDALIHRDLWFDAKTIGVNPEGFSGFAFDKLQGAIVLRPHARVTQLVRLDEGALRKALLAAPGARETVVNCGLLLNPIPMHDRETNTEVALPGPGGMFQGFFRTFTYSGVPLTMPSGQRAVQDTLTGTSVVDKIHLADLLAAFIRVGRAPGAEDVVKRMTGDLENDLAKLREDKSPLVAGWASYVLAGLSSQDEAAKIATAMADSPQWTTRLLSLFAGGAAGDAERKQIAGKLANDVDPTVKSAAAATGELPAHPPATTQPAAAPQ